MNLCVFDCLKDYFLYLERKYPESVDILEKMMSLRWEMSKLGL